MKYVKGGNLAELQDITHEETWTMASQMSSALVHIHQLGIMHRDLKPANILVSLREPFSTKLADFGESTTGANPKTFRGTLLYQAPEVSEPPYSKAVDIWALGVVVLERWYEWYSSVMEDLRLPDSRREGNGRGN